MFDFTNSTLTKNNRPMSQFKIRRYYRQPKRFNPLTIIIALLVSPIKGVVALSSRLKPARRSLRRRYV